MTDAAGQRPPSARGPRVRRRRLLAAALAGWLPATPRAVGAQGVVADGGWFVAGRPAPRAFEAAALLAEAAGHGLDPRAYGAAGLRDALARAASAPQGLAAADAAALETRLTRALQRYLHDLHAGRIDPRRLYAGVPLPAADGFDAASALRDALAAGRIADAVRAAAPSLPQYERLREALTACRGLAGHPAWRTPLPRGDAAWPAIERRLVAVGDLVPPPPADGAAPVPPDDAARIEALRAFQRRHGLADDGVPGPATRAALQVTPAARARQIELALERLRWTPLRRAPRMIVVNIPEFVLRAYAVVDGRIEVRQTMKVIVGKAFDTRTPLLMEELRAIEFSPYWNVPPSIARDELVPRLRGDPAHFVREGFEFVDGAGRAIRPFSAARLDAVLAGRLRLRQRPGPRNALGDIKFVFPNREHIFLHHTPAVQLFERARRDFSHGCIRVEQPVALARFVLHDAPEWSEDRIRLAMAQGRSETLAVGSPLPVLITYGTALVKDGRPHFYEDLYGHDRRLDAALRALPVAAAGR